MNIQQRTTSEVSNTEKVMAYNVDIYPPPPQDISNMFAAANHQMIMKLNNCWSLSFSVVSTLSFIPVSMVVCNHMRDSVFYTS